MRQFIAVDGEAMTDHKGEHKYVLMGSSLNRHVYDSRGLSTERCFEYLLSLQQDFPKAVLVAFGWNYDTNMILRDLDYKSLLRLWHTGQTRWRNYKIEWIPNKWLEVKAFEDTHMGGFRTPRGRFRVQDVFGFFQTSFVNALNKWEFDPQPEIETMKEMRGEFTEEMREQVTEYCVNECRLLVELMDELEIALESVEIKVRNWIGAGAIASALMRREGVQRHLTPDDDHPEKIGVAIRKAYYGGRSELFQQGDFPKLYDYDISSAYPSEACELPSLIGGRWDIVTAFDPLRRWGLWEVEWDVDSTIAPFPLRKGGDVYYPTNGRGWYYTDEVAAAMRLMGGIEVKRGFVFEPSSDERPFDFIPDLYRFRKRLKADGHAGEKVIKLGLNAIYGKLAQGYGFHGEGPPFQSYFWAGLITAGTRARLLELMSWSPENLVMVATDGIFFTEPIGATCEDGLGGLELTVMEDCFVAQPGVYSATVEGKRVNRSRGFFTKEINFDSLRQGFREQNYHHVGKYDVERFCGLGFSVLTRDFKYWRRWKRSTRRLSLYPSRKFLDSRSNGSLHHLPPTFPVMNESEPYRPKLGALKLSESELDRMVELVQGVEQPLRDF